MLFGICVAVALLLFSTLAGDSGLFLLVPSFMLLICFARLYGWVAQGGGESGGGGGDGGGGC